MPPQVLRLSTWSSAGVGLDALDDLVSFRVLRETTRGINFLCAGEFREFLGGGYEVTDQ